MEHTRPAVAIFSFTISRLPITPNIIPNIAQIVPIIPKYPAENIEIQRDTIPKTSEAIPIFPLL